MYVGLKHKNISMEMVIVNHFITLQQQTNVVVCEYQHALITLSIAAVYNYINYTV